MTLSLSSTLLVQQVGIPTRQLEILILTPPGLPKPITWTHGFFAAADRMMHKKPPQGKKSALAILKNARFFNTMPAFHAAGIGTMTFFAVWLRCCPIFPPQSPKPLDALTVARALNNANASSLLVIPSILEELSKDQALSDALRNVSNVIYSGGVMPKQAGEKLKNKTHLISYIGSTEFAIFPHWIIEDPDDWEYVAIDPCYNVNFYQHADDLYEAVVVRSKECEMYQPVWHVFPDLQEYHTRDLYSRHSTKSGLWRYRGRMDDIIVFVNGEKLDPIAIEDHVCSHVAVNSAIVAGDGRFHAALLVEPTESLHTAKEKAHLLESIWPLIEKANENSPAHGKISKAYILFTSPGKPMLRAGKGTVQRRLTLTAYFDEIDALYADAESFMTAKVPPLARESETSSLEHLVLHLVQQLALHNKQIGLNDDFFLHGGIDSLQVLQLIRQLGNYGYATGDRFNTLSPSIVYNNPTASSLAVAIQDLRAASQERFDLSSRPKIQEMQNLLSRFSGPRDRTPTGRPEILMLTGSTGALGSYIIDSLLKAPKVNKIYCLDRAVSAERQAKIDISRGLSTNFDNCRVELLKGDLTAPSFGLAESIFEQISTRVTRVIHCAWPVDFNLSLQSFSPQLQGVRALIDFANLPKKTKSIFFISSIASIGKWTAPESVPETPLWDVSLPLPTGYAESKFLAEQLLLGSASLVDVSVCRVGQIAGPALSDKGVWKKDEWLPSLIKSSKYLKLLPTSLSSSMRDLDWIPIDLLSTTLVELALLPRNESAIVYHAVNPRTCDWQSLLPTIQDLLDGAEEFAIVPFDEWVEALRESAPQTINKKQEIEKNPAIKLLDFFEGLPRAKVPRLNTVETQKRSRTLREMRAVAPEDMARWMRQWGPWLRNAS